MFLEVKQDQERYETRFYKFPITKQDEVDVFRAKIKRS